MIWAQKIRAGALQLVLFVSAIIAVLLLCFLLLSHTHSLFVKKTDLTIALIQAADQGLRDSFAQTGVSGEDLVSTSKNDLGISVAVSQDYWGVFPLRTAIATKEKLGFEKRAFIGATQPNRAALYLQDRQRPMVIAGQAQILGDAFLPERGIKPGNIRGYGYNRSQLVYGRQLQSQAELPKFSSTWQTQLQQLTNPGFVPKGEEFSLKKGLVLKNSFKEPLQLARGSTIRLDQLKLAGHILIWASQKIIVESSCQLQDIVLMAPEIEIKRGFQGTIQALASKSIKIDRSCVLQYPSALVVNSTKPQSKNHPVGIAIGPNTDVRGMVIYQEPPSEERTFSPHISVAENAQLMGELYCSGNLELKGTVLGTVTTQGFVALENGNSYQNHLFNGKIDSSLLPQAYGGIWYGNAQLNQVMKWLY